MSDDCSAVTEFIILGLTDDQTLCVILFVLFLGVYVVTLVGNLSIIILIRNSSQLHTPMYLFLSHLAFVDIGYSSSVTPFMLINFLTNKTSIPLGGCVAQFCFVATLGATECLLLAVMAYDRYMAICNPLLYSINMSPMVCNFLLISSYLGGSFNAWIFTGFLLSLSFCGSNKINHFFCDYSPLLKLSNYQDNLAEILPPVSGGSVITISVLIVLISHLTAVTLFYGTTTFIYVMPKFSYSTDENKVVSVFYTVMIPMLNPLIYSLRNSEVKGALRKLMNMKHLSS